MNIKGSRLQKTLLLLYLFHNSLSSPLLCEGYKKQAIGGWKANYGTTLPLSLLENSGPQMNRVSFSEKVNSLEQFLSWAPPGSPPTHSLLLSGGARG